MTLITSLPTVDVYIAFNPTSGSTPLFNCISQALPASGSSNSYWTNCGVYLRGYDDGSGKQHYLDRAEAGTMRLTMDNRDGFFFNGTTNGTGYVVQTRQPIAITETWAGVTYPIFFGLIDSATEQILDQQNSDLLIQASDFLKQLSLKTMSSSNFWPTYANSQSAANWYRCDATRTGIITNATGNGTTITYTAINNFNAGDNVTITGLGILSGKTLNLQEVTIATVSSSQFTVTNATVGVSSGTGSAYRIAIEDQIGSDNGDYIGVVSFPTYGAMIYDTDTCVDVGSGSTTGTGAIRLPTFAGAQGALDFWVLGQGIANTFITGVTSGGDSLLMGVNDVGELFCTDLTTTVTTSIKVDDGFWHHVGFVENTSGVLQLYVDGTFHSLAAIGTFAGWTTSTNLVIGFLTSAAGAYYDEIIVSNRSSLSTLEHEVQNRYIAGTLLQLPTNPTQPGVLSGDRIAEILCLAGFGYIQFGALVLYPNLFYINQSGTPWAKGASGNGSIDVGPYYWDTPVTTSTATDLVGQITDTDIGTFFQNPDGTFSFLNQLFYGTWTWGGSSGTWTPNTYSPAADHVWTDDDSGYAYIGSTCQPIRDDADTWMLVEVTPQAGVMQVYEDVAGEERWGFSTLTKDSTLHPTLNLALSTATFLGYLYRSPLPRVQAVELRSATDEGAQMTALIGAKLGDVVTFKRTPPGASTSGTYPAQVGAIDTNMIIESISRSFTAEPGTLNVTFILDPYPIRS